MRFTFNADIPDLSDELAKLQNPGQVQEDIRWLVAAYRALDAIAAGSGTPKEAAAELANFAAVMQSALDAMGGPVVALIAVPDEAAGSIVRTLARLVAAANAAREDIRTLLPKRGGQAASLYRDTAVRRTVDVLRDAGPGTHFALTARILKQCGVPAPETGAGISAIYERMQKRIPGRRVIRF